MMLMPGQTQTSGYIQQEGFWVPVLPEGESVHTFTHEELIVLLEQAYNDGYSQARNRYAMPVTTSAVSTATVSLP